MKYKSYTELAKAFKSGELDREKYLLLVDNDCTRLTYLGDDMDEDEAYEHCRELFAGESGLWDLIDACKAAGIPADGV